VPPQSLTRLDAAPSDACFDAALTQRLAALGEVITFVGVQLFGPLARPAGSPLDGLDTVDEAFEHLGIVHLCAGER